MGSICPRWELPSTYEGVLKNKPLSRPLRNCFRGLTRVTWVTKMKGMTTVIGRPRCAARTYRGYWIAGRCENPGKVQAIDGKWYCGVHDPARAKKRDEENAARWKAEHKHQARKRRIQETRREVAEFVRNCASAGRGISPEDCQALAELLAEAER